MAASCYAMNLTKSLAVACTVFTGTAEEQLAGLAILLALPSWGCSQLISVLYIDVL